MSFLSEYEKSVLIDTSFWDGATVKQRELVDFCLAEKSTLLCSHRSKLVSLDLKFIAEFSEENCDWSDSTDRKRCMIKSCVYVLCHEFFLIARNLDYKSAENIGAISSLTDKFFSLDSSFLLNDIRDVLSETIYYIAGWSLNAMKKISFCQKKNDGRSNVIFR